MTSETNRRKQKLTVKDLITVGVFSAIILICISLSGGPFAMFPTLTFYFPVGAALLAGPVYLLLVAKVPKPGPIFIAGLMMAIFCYVTGMHIGMTIGYLAGSALADLVARTGRYRNIKINILYCFLPRRNRVLSCIFHQSAGLGKQDVGKGHPAGIPGYNGGNRQPADFDNHVGRHCFSRPFQRFYRQSTVKEAI